MDREIRQVPASQDNGTVKTSIAVDNEGAVTIRMGQNAASVLLTLLGFVGGDDQKSFRYVTNDMAALLTEIGVDNLPITGPDSAARGMVEFRSYDYQANNPASGFMPDALFEASVNMTGPMGQFHADDMDRVLDGLSGDIDYPGESNTLLSECPCLGCQQDRLGTISALTTTDAPPPHGRRSL